MPTKPQLIQENAELTKAAGDLFMQLEFAKLGLKMALPYVAEALEKQAMAQTRSNPSITSWPLHTVNVNGVGLKLSATPNWRKRSKVTTTEIDGSGNDATFRAVTTAEVQVRIEFGFFGVENVTGTMQNIETGLTGSNDVEIENVLSFQVSIAGKVKDVRITVKGQIAEAFFGLAAGYSETIASLNSDQEVCVWCGEMHQENKIVVEVSIS